MLEIDGSLGEAGGQVLRTALSLSAVLRKPFRLFNIRRGRSRPGLMPQHLMAVRATKTISHAQVTGDVQGSTELTFVPGGVNPGDYQFDIGTAGSTSLVLQTLIPPLIFAEAGSTVSLTGGTHVPFSPPFEYIAGVFIPVLRRMGIKLHPGIEQYGFYPTGGGRVFIKIEPVRNVNTLALIERGEIVSITGLSGVANLPISIAVRQAAAAQTILSENGLHADIQTAAVRSVCPGTFIFLKMKTENCIAGFSSIGKRGKKAELIGGEAARKLLDYHYSSQCLDPNLADQIVLYLALADGPSEFTTSSISNHLMTNLLVIRKFIDMQENISGTIGSPGKVGIMPVRTPV